MVFGAIKGSRGQIVLFNKQPKEKSSLVYLFLKQQKTKQNKPNPQKRGKQKIKQAQISLPCSPRMRSLFGDDNDDERTRASGTRKEAQEPGSPTRGFSRGLLCSLLEMESFLAGYLPGYYNNLPGYYNNESKHTSLHELN